jgi:hypothetical protein
MAKIFSEKEFIESNKDILYERDKILNSSDLFIAYALKPDSIRKESVEISEILNKITKNPIIYEEYREKGGSGGDILVRAVIYGLVIIFSISLRTFLEELSKDTYDYLKAKLTRLKKTKLKREKILISFNLGKGSLHFVFNPYLSEQEFDKAFESLRITLKGIIESEIFAGTDLIEFIFDNKRERWIIEYDKKI